MHKLVAAVAVGMISVLSAGAAASAASPYPPEPTMTVLSDSTVAPGAEFTATLTDCAVGEVVEGTVSGDRGTATCTGSAGGALGLAAPAGGPRGLAAPAGAARGRVALVGAAISPAAPAGSSATVTLTAPMTPGNYPVTLTGLSSGVTATAILTVVGATGSDDDGELPATGSSSAPIAQLGAGVVIAGLGLMGVAMHRRRSRATA